MSLFLTRIIATLFCIQSLYNQKWLEQVFKNYMWLQEHTES